MEEEGGGGGGGGGEAAMDDQNHNNWGSGGGYERHLLGDRLLRGSPPLAGPAEAAHRGAAAPGAGAIAAAININASTSKFREWGCPRRHGEGVGGLRGCGEAGEG